MQDAYTIISVEPHWAYNGCEFSFSMIRVKLDFKQVTLQCSFLFCVYCRWIMDFALWFCCINSKQDCIMQNKVLLDLDFYFI